MLALHSQSTKQANNASKSLVKRSGRNPSTANLEQLKEVMR
jgi:hypothetical protein